MEQKKLVSKKLATIALILSISAIILATIFDIIAFKDTILQFIAALIIPCFAFILFIIFYFISIVLVFGVYIQESQGFWPTKLTRKLFLEMLGSIKITDKQIQLFQIFRIIIICICVGILILAIIAKIKAKKEAKEELLDIKKAKRRGRTSRILSILGILVSVAALFITSK
jgi:hypothetical protein